MTTFVNRAVTRNLLLRVQPGIELQNLLNKRFLRMFWEKNIKFTFLQNQLVKLTQLLRKSVKLLLIFNYFQNIATEWIKI